MCLYNVQSFVIIKQGDDKNVELIQVLFLRIRCDMDDVL